MSITLETIAAPGATPIANNAASAKSFANDYAKLDVPNISDQDRNAIAILGLIFQLTAAGGANYKSNHAGLIQDSMVYSGGISNLNPVTARAAYCWDNGRAADATLSADVPTLLQQARDIADLPALTQERLIAFLRAQVGQ